MRNVGDIDTHDEARGATIRDELSLLGVPVVQVTDKGHHGALGSFTFTRAWYYWMVSGPVPLAVAREMYENPVGRRDVRVTGHCGCPPPEQWTEETPDGPCVTLYHIDSGAGLRLFVDTIRRHGLTPAIEARA